MRKIPFKWLRVGALVILLGAAWAVGVKSGLADSLTKEGLRKMVLDAGPWGVLAYIGLFCVGNLIQIPGIVFVAGAVLVYGLVTGTALSIAGGLVAISFSFWVARVVGGDPLSKLKGARVKRIMDRLHERPVRTMALLRVFMQMSPALNVMLALSGVRYRDYMAGAMIGMWIPVIVMGIAVSFFV